ncbi:MAG: disulfide oxidoreductase [Anaerolineales bacterium]
MATTTHDTPSPFRTKLVIFLKNYGAQLAFGPALAALLGSLYYSEIAGFEPCELCWFQRILMYPLTVLILVGVFNDDRLLPKYVLPLSVTGMGVSTYHYLLQNHVFGGEQICSFGVSCTLRYVNLWGFVTIPFMALTAFTMITVLMWGTHWAYKQEAGEEEDEEGWDE